MGLSTLMTLLGRLGRLNESVVQQISRRHETTVAELQVLGVLSHDGGGAVNPSALARSIVQTTAGITSTITRLEQRGLVRRLPDPADGRGRLVEATAEGRRLYRRAFADMTTQYELIFGEVDVDGSLVAVRELVRALEQFTDHRSTADFERG